MPAAEFDALRAQRLGAMPEQTRALLSRPVAALGLLTRSANALRVAGIDTVRALVGLTRVELCERPGMGVAGVDRIEAVLREHGLALGLSVAALDTVPGAPRRPQGAFAPVLHCLLARPQSFDAHDVMPNFFPSARGRRGRSRSGHSTFRPGCSRRLLWSA